MMKTQQYNKTQSITKALKWKEKICVHKERKKEKGCSSPSSDRPVWTNQESDCGYLTDSWSQTTEDEI